MKKRTGQVHRKTAETNISMRFTLAGRGQYTIDTSIPFMDHMLSLFAKHGGFDLSIKAKGDTDVDDHHLVEDLGICLGGCIDMALGDKKGIARFGNASIPMDESKVDVAVDLSGRSFLVFNCSFSRSIKDSFEYGLLEDFFRAVSLNSKMTLHCNCAYGRDNHHIAEALCKAFGVALGQAAAITRKGAGVPSTKGRL
jgi:imidazoleglycerol-phosphate dehydratase